MYPKGYLGRDLVDDVCKEQGVELDTVMEVGSASSLLRLVEALSIGATIQPRGLLRNIIRRGPILFRFLLLIRHLFVT
nr:hypothetical protein [Bacillus pumilus]